MDNNNVFKKAREFVYRNARPLDLALWRYHFEDGSRRDVIDALSFYQNGDGGFGHGIEPDFLNPNSTPIGTWKAVTVLKEIGIEADEEITRNILEYLTNSKDFADGKWYVTVKSNNDYPHAVWWECRNGNGEPNDNPTISLAGFVFKYADKNSRLYKICADTAAEAVSKFIDRPICDMHITPLYLDLFEYCSTIKKFDLFDIDAFKTSLYTAIQNTVCKDSDKWLKEYVCRPSRFFDSYKIVFDILGIDPCKKEGELLLKEQLPDGSYPTPWIWHNDYKEYYVAANRWKSSMLKDNMLYLKALNLI